MGPTVTSAVLAASCSAWHPCASLRDTEPRAGAAAPCAPTAPVVLGPRLCKGRNWGIITVGKWAPGGAWAMLTAPVRSSRPVKGWGLTDAGGYTACRTTTKTRRMKNERKFNIRSVLRKRKYERTLEPKRPPICFRA